MFGNVIIGGSKAARLWVENSTLPDADRTILLRFLDHFPTLTFFKVSPESLDRIEKEDGVVLPRWLRMLVQTVAYVMPDHYVWARFDRSLNPAMTGDHLQDYWYSLDSFGGGAGSEERMLLREMQGGQLYPIGTEDVPGRSRLAINVADLADRRIYEYGPEHLIGEYIAGYPLEESISVMFESYPDMFSNIAAFKLVAKADADDIDPKDWPSPIVVEARR